MKTSQRSAVLIYVFALGSFLWALSQVDLFSTLTILQSLSLLDICTIIVLNSVVIIFNSRRWGVLLEQQGYPLSLKHTILHRFTCFAVSYCTPAPHTGGEPILVYFVKKLHQIPTAVVIASVVAEKMINTFVSIIVLAIFCILCRKTFPIIEYALWLTTAGMVLLSITFLFYKCSKRPLLGTLFRFLGTTITKVIAQSEEHMAELLFSRAWWYSVFLAICSWLIVIAEYWLTYYFLGLPLSFLQIALIFLTMNFAFLLPTPGGWGVVESSQVIVLLAIGFDPAVGISAVILMRLREIIICGMGFYWMHCLTRKISFQKSS